MLVQFNIHDQVIQSGLCWDAIRTKWIMLKYIFRGAKILCDHFLLFFEGVGGIGFCYQYIQYL
jgi:hypothetical protein